MSRLSELVPEQLTEEQLGIFNEIILSRGGSIHGPFLAWLRSPVLADRAQKLGEFCRYQTCLPRRLSELAILVTASLWRSNVEWQIHAPIALEAGLSDAIINALQDGREPGFDDGAEAAVYGLARELYETRRVGDAAYQKAVSALGENGVVELVGILGYYALVAMTLNVFEVSLPGPQTAPFTD